MFFASDNWAGAHPAILEALTHANDGYRASYGGADEDKALETRFGDIFETDVSVFLVNTGTAANALALSAMARPGDVFYCHTEAHARVDECGAPLFFAPGLQLEGVAGPFGKLTPDALHLAIETTMAGGLNAGRVGGLSLTQATEAGTVYTPNEITALVETLRSVSGRACAPVHMDGSRFTNALVALNCTPAELTWKRGVDAVSFGATKNGCLCAEAIVVFNTALADDLTYLRKRAGHHASKMRFMTAQFDAYFKDDLWLALARHANAQARKLDAVVGGSPHVRLAWQGQINEVFAIADATKIDQWISAGLTISKWWPPQAECALVGENQQMIRFVTSFATTDEEIDAAKRLLQP